MTLSELTLQKIFYYFAEISKIPHGSYNTDKISEYLSDFGNSRNLKTIRDELGNVIIIKEASEGYENEPTVILQGHMDMVAVSTPNSSIDMKTSPLDLRLSEDGTYLYAKDTSLGGDDGIALAYALAILDDDTIKTPRLEVIFTVNEETGMEGAFGIDLSMLKGNRLINLDSEEEGIFLTSCAGGLRATAHIPVNKQPIFGTYYDVEIGGLLGGHSGEEIGKDRGNAIKLAANLLHRYMKSGKKAEGTSWDTNGISTGKVYITNITGGVADNAIPTSVKFGIVVPFTHLFEESVRAFTEFAIEELGAKDPGFYCKIDRGTKMDTLAYECGKAIRFLFTVPNGVQAISHEVPGLVETSLNLGMISLDKESGQINATFCVRSSKESAKHELTDKIECLSHLTGGFTDIRGDYPGWPYREKSPLRDKMVSVYEKMYGCKPQIHAIHAGLECGLLGNKISDLDCISIGPDIKDIHTTNEKLYIESATRVYDYLTTLLATKD